MAESIKKNTTGAARVYIAALCALLATLRREEPVSKYNTVESFSQLLSVAFDHFGLFANNLASEEHISKASISKWQNGHALPSAPTRKTVINWIVSNLEKEHRRLVSEYDVDECEMGQIERQLQSA